MDYQPSDLVVLRFRLNALEKSVKEPSTVETECTPARRKLTRGGKSLTKLSKKVKILGVFVSQRFLNPVANLWSKVY